MEVSCKTKDLSDKINSLCLENKEPGLSNIEVSVTSGFMGNETHEIPTYDAVPSFMKCLR